MSISRRSFVRAAGVAGVSAVWSAQLLARGREAAVGEGREFDQASTIQPSAAQGAVAGPIRLNSNENPVGPPRVAIDALLAALGEAGRYPSAASDSVSEGIAAHHEVPSASVVVGSGSGEILRMAVYAWSNLQRPLVTAAPSFEDPARYAELVPSPVIAVPLKPTDLALDLDEMATQARGAGLVFVCNPNNPTGVVHDAAAITAFVDEVHRTSPDTTVLIDEAYHEYVDHPGYATAMPLALSRPNVVISRTFSKLYGMAGLRLGYAVGRPDTIAALRRHRLANSVNALVAPAAAAALSDTGLVARERARNREAREFARDAFAALGYPSCRSATNFIMVDVRQDVRTFAAACLARGVRIGRPFPPLDTYARISVGTMAEMSTAVGVFRDALARS